MIIYELRIKNIRSYGTGVDGNGIIVKFNSGINRISGCNGSGKSTIIEAIGYALFEAKPKSIENFDVTTYFVRMGCSSAEIDITFNFCNETYRIERGLGTANKRRAKVILVDDNSICAENEQEVSSFLCRLFGFINPSHLSEIFTKLIGIKQGHLTRPFDSKPSHAKEFFEPLLEVGIFRQCYDQIKSAMDIFDIQINKFNCLLATEEERIRERQDSPAAIITKQEILLSQEHQVKAAIKNLAIIRNKKEKLETESTAIIEITHKLNEAKLSHSIQQQKCLHAQTQAEVTKQAVNTLKRVLPTYNLFVEAESNIRILRNKQDQQRNIIYDQTISIQHQLELNSKLQSVTDRIKFLTSQIETKNSDLLQIKKKYLIDNRQVEQSDDFYRDRIVKVRQLEQNLLSICTFVTNLPDNITHQQLLLKKISELDFKNADVNYDQLKNTTSLSIEAEHQLQNITNELAVLMERHNNLVEQKKAIENGHCPFSRKQCCHYDKISVIAKLDQLAIKIRQQATLVNLKRNLVDTLKKQIDTIEQDIASVNIQYKYIEILNVELQKLVKNLVPDNILQNIKNLSSYVPTIPDFPTNLTYDSQYPDVLHQNILTFQNSVNDWWKVANAIATQKLDKEIEELYTEQNRYHINYQADLLARISRDIASMHEDKQAELMNLEELKRHIAKADITILAYTKKLTEFNGITDELTRQANILDASREDYLEYLSTYPIAKQAQSKEAELQSCLAMERHTASILATMTDTLEAISNKFDHQILDKVTAEYLQKSNEVAVCSTNFNSAKESLRTEERRYTEWNKACSAKNQIVKQIERLRATKKLAELSRNILKQAAPTVAQYLCNVISTRAQKIFNAINKEPVELQWCANRYSLRIIPGERRFAMLSGGEQNKLALAMTLAMIKEFSKLKFCIFDEPTYGVDTDSRNKLVKAILAAQGAADIEQLIIVSHDNAFESQTEHCIMLTKTSIYGTEVKYCE